MAKNRETSPPSPRNGFPNTRLSVLRQAAGGEWETFLRAYLEPCWREIVVACRVRGIGLDESEELFQELMVRLIKPGALHRAAETAEALQSRGGPFRGNLPARYLWHQVAGGDPVRFQTYLKGTILNLIRESLRRRARQPKHRLDEQLAELEPAVEHSVSEHLDRRWFFDCLDEAAARFRAECHAARTKGRQRLFDVLYRSIAEEQSPGVIALQSGLDRTTVSGLLRQARNRFVAILEELSGIADLPELKARLGRDPHALQSAFRKAGVNPGRHERIES
jgi:hypothetical protein